MSGLGTVMGPRRRNKLNVTDDSFLRRLVGDAVNFIIKTQRCQRTTSLAGNVLTRYPQEMYGIGKGKAEIGRNRLEIGRNSHSLRLAYFTRALNVHVELECHKA